jgi:hypothetical protein
MLFPFFGDSGVFLKGIELSILSSWNYLSGKKNGILP